MRWRVELRSTLPFVQSSPTLVARITLSLRPPWRRASDDLFGAPVAVNGRRVDQIDPIVKRSMNGANGLLIFGSAPHPAAHGPGAKCNSGTNNVCTLDFDVVEHGCPFIV